jgi:hypothetical protein
VQASTCDQVRSPLMIKKVSQVVKEYFLIIKKVDLILFNRIKKVSFD